MTRPLILGTAGHIDHGKTTLVRALTGTDTDRLPEEKARGITIELGFAHLDLDGRRVGIVDVPGHERFVRAMVAGAGGIDVVMLVVAADEGVMPQTREHLDVCRLLEVRHGLVVLTKADLVDEEWLELVKDDVAAAVAGSFLEDAPVVAFSARDVEAPTGVEALLGALREVAAQVGERPASGPARLPVDRVFTMHGFGTVVTGTLLAGRLGIGDAVTLVPSGLEAKVRGIQVHGQVVSEAVGGQRTALNLQGVDRDQVERGNVVVGAQALEPTHMVDGTLRVLEHLDRPLKSRARLLLHAGTATARATVVLLDRAEAAPGDSTYAQLRLDRPLMVLPGDHFVLRGFAKTETHGRTVGGGEVLVNRPPKHRANDLGAVGVLTRLRGAEPALRLEILLEQAGHAGLDRRGMLGRTGLSDKALDAALGEVLGRGRAVRFDKERDGVVHSDALADLQERACALLTQFHEDHPRRRGMAREELRSRLPAGDNLRLFHALTQRLEKAGRIEADRDLVRLAGFAPRDDEKLEAIKRAVVERLAAEGTTPPRARELPALLAEDPALVTAALDELAESGELVRIRDDIWLEQGALERLRERVVAWIGEHGSIDAAGFKQIVGGSRKFAIPLAEHFDKERLTMRVGDARVLRRAAS